MEVGIFRMSWMSWASLYIFTCQPFLWRGEEPKFWRLRLDFSLDLVSMYPGEIWEFCLKDVLKKRNPKIWIHPTQTHSWKSMVFNCCPAWVLFLQMPWNQSPPQFRPRRVPKCFFRWFKAGPFQTFTLQSGFGGGPIDDVSGGKDPLKWQIDTGEGFLRDAPDDAMGDMMGSGMALAKATVFWRGTRKMWWWMKCDLGWCDILFNRQKMVWYEFFSNIGDVESCSVLGNLTWNPFQFSHIGVFTIAFQTNFDCTYPKQMMFQKCQYFPIP